MDDINRSVAIVTPKQPFLDWTKLDDKEGLAEGVFQNMHADPHASLLPEYEDDDERQRVIEHFWPAIFESMLDSWSRDRSGWPRGRDFAMFEAWFDVRLCSVVEDLLVSEPLERLD